MITLREAARLVIPPRLKVGWELFALVLFVTGYTVAVAWLDENYQHGPITAGDAQITIINGLILGTLVGFRTNEASKRWWEGRVLWGQLINDARNLCIKGRSLVRMDDDDRKRWAMLMAAFPVAVKDHLRDAARLQKLAGFEDATDQPAHVPLYVAGLIQAVSVKWHRDGNLDSTGLWMLDPLVRDLMNICGGCERIKNTPLPSSYRAILHHGLTLIALVTPIFLVQDLGYWSVIVMAIVTYFAFGIELVAVHIEEPFGCDGDDLPLDAYCATIAKSVEQTMA